MLGRELQVQYSADHRVVASRDYGGERYAIDLDELTRLLEERDSLGRKTTYEYHHLTRLVTHVTYPDGSTWRARYDDKGNLLAETDALRT